jgi:hypothetical protein
MMRLILFQQISTQNNRKEQALSGYIQDQILLYSRNFEADQFNVYKIH